MKIVFNATFMGDCSEALSNLVFFEEENDGASIVRETRVSTELKPNQAVITMEHPMNDKPVAGASNVRPAVDQP